MKVLNQADLELIYSYRLKSFFLLFLLDPYLNLLYLVINLNFPQPPSPPPSSLNVRFPLVTIPLQRWCHLFCLRPLRFHQCYSPKYKFPRIFVLHFRFWSKLNGSLIELSKITQLDITGKTVNDRFRFAVLWLVESVSEHHSHFYKISAFYLVKV